MICVWFVLFFPVLYNADAGDRNRFKRSADSTCERKIKRLSNTITRRFKFLSDAIDFEKEERQELGVQLNEDIATLRARIDTIDKSGGVQRKGRLNAIVGGDKSWRQVVGSLRFGLETEKRHLRNVANSLDSLKSFVQSHGGESGNMSMIHDLGNGEAFQYVMANISQSKNDIMALNVQVQKNRYDMGQLQARLVKSETKIGQMNIDLIKYKKIVDYNGRELAKTKIDIQKRDNIMQKIDKIAEKAAKDLEKNVEVTQEINECMKNNGGCQHNCVNTQRSFYCTCQVGFVTRENRCDDINECMHGNGGCNQICVNTIGSRNCRCRSNFKLDGSGRRCVADRNFGWLKFKQKAIKNVLSKLK